MQYELLILYAGAFSAADVLYVMVTNGTLLDESFLEFAVRHNMEIGLSHDGLMHEKSRRMGDDSSSFECLEDMIALLHKYLPQSTAMCTIHPLFVDRLAGSVRSSFP